MLGFFVLGLGCLATALRVRPDDFDAFDEKCNPVMKENGLTWRFPGSVAHGIHSLTLEDVRYYFEPTASEENNIPTVNYNLTDEKMVLPHAKLYGFDTTFETVAMRHLDQVLKDMGNKNWYLANYSTLERLAHTIHMDEVWTKAKDHYTSIAARGYNEELCTCVKDVNRNGVLNLLKLMALKIRYPGITSGRSSRNVKQLVLSPGKYIFKIHIETRDKERARRFNFDGRIREIKKRAATQLVDGDEGMAVSLDSQKHWLKWKSLMKSMAEHDSYELAIFLHCMLNH